MKKLAWLLVLVMLFSLVTACGKTADKNDDNTPAPDTDTTPDPDPDPKPDPDPDPKPDPKPDPDPDPDIVDDGKFLEEDSADFEKQFTAWEKITLENTKWHIGELVLVDKDHTVDSANFTEIVRVKDYNANGLSSVMSSKTMLNYVAMRKLQEMTFYMHEALNVNYLYSVQAGYLTNDELNDLNANYPDEYPEKGGESALNTGNGVVLSVYTGAMNYGFRNNAVGNIASWTEENAYKYGFVFLDDIGDNANLRYVGVPHATYMQENDLDLAGYIEKLKDGEKLQITDYRNLTWTVYRVAASDNASTEIEVPAGMIYSVSGDNDGGFIVTVKGICQ